MKPTILITRTFFPDLFEPLKQEYVLKIWPKNSTPGKKWILDNIYNAEGLITNLTDPIDAEIILAGAAGKLKVISQIAVGFDNIDVSSATKNHIPVGNTPGVLTETTADFTWALLMALARQVIISHNEVQNGIWRPWDPAVFAGADVYGKTIGIIGFGRIGKAVAKRAHGFGMQVLVFDPGSAVNSKETNVRFSSLEELLSQSDFVTLHANLTDSSRRLLGKNQFEMMKPTAFLVNTARGAMIDNSALLDALQHKKIAGAALDVFDPEPIPMDHPLLKMPNVIITPHIASASLATRRRMAVMTIENSLAGINGERLPYCVNPEVYND
jgi:glyoxylate reductase